MDFKKFLATLTQEQQTSFNTLTPEQITLLEQGSREQYKDFVPRLRLNQELENVKTLKTQLKERDTQLEGLKDIDVEKLNQTIIDLQTANNKQKKDFEKQVADIQFNYELDAELASYNPHDVGVLKSKLNTKTITRTDAGFVGLKEQMDSILANESLKWLFKPTTQPPSNIAGATPQNTNTPPASPTGDEWQLDINKLTF